MSTVEFVKAYIERLCKEIGTTSKQIYNSNTCAWYFARGSSTIEVFLTNKDEDDGTTRVFIRCFAPVFPIPRNPVTRHNLFHEILELNTKYMGIKLSTIPDKGLVCAIAERDIDGMDYHEFIALISDISNYADLIDDHLSTKFDKH